MRKFKLSVLVVASVASGFAMLPARATIRAAETKPVSAHRAHPASMHDPNAMALASAGPGYGLFGCQVGRSIGQCYDPYQMRRAYGTDAAIAAGYDGTGKTIIIVDAFQNPNLISQVDTFNVFYGLPRFNQGGNSPTLTIQAPDGLTPFVPGDDNMAGWAEEISLDFECAHAIAPRANIVLELGADNSDVALLDAINDAIDNNRGNVISMSFGEADVCLGPELTAAWHRSFANVSRQGITLFASSGDEGAAQVSCDGTSWILSASSPASDPLVVGVGGTELHAADYCLTQRCCNPATHPAPGTYLSEIGWNEGGPYGDFQSAIGPATIAGGGGFSDVWGTPSYQQGTLHGAKQRGVPDVSYNAAVLHGVLTYLNIPGIPPGFYRFGGTSAGAPQWAALAVIAAQAAGHDYGFINAAIYKIGQNAPDVANAFHDVTSGVNSALEFDINDEPVNIVGYSAGVGWDAFTGFGSPKTVGLVNELPLFWSAGQGDAAIAQSGHGKGHAAAFPQAQPH